MIAAARQTKVEKIGAARYITCWVSTAREEDEITGLNSEVLREITNLLADLYEVFAGIHGDV